MSRLIDADALLGVLNGLLLENVHEQEMIERIIRYAPTVSEQQWILVTERLPSAEYGESDSVLVQFENETNDVLYFDGGNWCYPFGGEPYIGVNYENGWSNKVVAWRELPEPYRGE